MRGMEVVEVQLCLLINSKQKLRDDVSTSVLFVTKTGTSMLSVLLRDAKSTGVLTELLAIVTLAKCDTHNSRERLAAA
ncbi:hypothetical protein ERJ75_000128700 [Trypanosoma vivax]|nr:hypothetical protein ERJ75_000128700 [Trypanosoma vivax]